MVEAIKPESEITKRNVDADSYGVAESNVRFAGLNVTTMFVINEEEEAVFACEECSIDYFSEVNVLKDIDDSFEERLSFVDFCCEIDFGDVRIEVINR